MPSLHTAMIDTPDMRSLSRDARHGRRVQVIPLRKAGYTHDAIAGQTGLSHTGVFDICKRLGPAGRRRCKMRPADASWAKDGG
jgi:hypothetical protein